MWTLPVTEIERLIAEDVPAGDLTTETLAIADQPARMTFKARGAMTVAGVEVAAQIVRSCGVDVLSHLNSGARRAAGDVLLIAEGRAVALHKAWKASQTLTEILSGIATAARAVVDAVETVNPDVRVACTRKTFPGARRLSQIAVRAGGAILHRNGLSETILVFPEHRVFLAGEPFAALARRLKRAAPEKKIVIEVVSVEEACKAIEAGFDAIQLEKFDLDDVGHVSAMAAKTENPPLVIAAGGINPENAAAYVRAGAGLIVTSWPYTARPADVKVILEVA